MTNDIQRPDEQNENMKVPNFENLYQEEALNLLKLANEQVKFYYERKSEDNVDTYDLHQVIHKLESVQSDIPGFDYFKKSLCEDISTLIRYLDKEVWSKRKKIIQEITKTKSKIQSLKEEKVNCLIFAIFLFQWNKFSKFNELAKKIVEEELLLNKLENELLTVKRSSINTEQLIYVSHMFREKYLNIPYEGDSDKTPFDKKD